VTLPAVPGDRKDWTWVLQRPCPECGFDSVAVDRSQVGAVLRDNAASWDRCSPDRTPVFGLTL